MRGTDMQELVFHAEPWLLITGALMRFAPGTGHTASKAGYNRQAWSSRAQETYHGR